MRWLLLCSIWCVACGPSREEREAKEARRKQHQDEEAAAKKQDADNIVRLQHIAETTRASCIAEFARAAKDNLGLGGEGKGCALTARSKLKLRMSTVGNTPAQMAKGMEFACDEYAKKLDLDTKQTLFKKSTADNQVLLDELDQTWLVGMVYETYKAPSIHEEVAGGPKAFTAGAIKGTAYLYRVSTGALECGGATEAASSDKVDAFKRDDKLMAEVEASHDIDVDLAANVGKALVAGHTAPLAAGAYQPPPPPPTTTPSQSKAKAPATNAKPKR